MEQLIKIDENDIKLVFKITENKSVYLFHCQITDFIETDIKPNQEDWYRLVEIQTSGENQDDHHGSKYTGTLPGRRLVYQNFKDYINTLGRKIEVYQKDLVTEIIVVSHIQFIKDTNVIETFTTVENKSNNIVGLEYVSSFALTGITKSALANWDKSALLKIPHNTWYGEFQWKDYTPSDLGLCKVFHYSTKRISISSTGTWNSHEYLPMGYICNKETNEGWLFSIIHNGSWHYEISDIKDNLYLQISGPTEAENHWYKELKPNDLFESIHTAIAITKESFENAVMEMTRYRRIVRRPNEDNIKLPVIFNDFMNCLEGDPTEEKLLPLIDAASDIGCEYFTIDAGWYANGSWWSRVGEWEPSEKRFPNGIYKVLNYIKQKGMIPGLWLELEVMGINCEIANQKPDNWFFIRHGKRVIDHGRYQLDYRNLEVIEFANNIIKRLVEDYGVGYIKMDYNINAGIGTEFNADSFGDGLLEHNKAYLQWLDNIFKKYPNLIIENCASGGMRLNDALLRRHSIQSSSDQTNYKNYSTISASSLIALPPEQNAVWSYPLYNASEEQTVFNMVNAMTMRIHQSGHLAKLSELNLNLIREGIECYKSYRHLIPKSYPFWPIKIPEYSDQTIVLGLQNDECAYVAVWRLENIEDTIVINLDKIKKLIKSVVLIYPSHLPCEYKYHKTTNQLIIKQPKNSARLFKVIT